MNANVVDLVKDYLTFPLKNKIADTINSDTTLTHSALDAGIPGLLNSFMNASTNPSRSPAIFTAVSNQNGAILKSFDEILSTNNYIKLSNAGTNILADTIGSTTTNTLAGAVSNHSGLSKNASSSLLGLITPIILAILKHQLLDSGDFSARNLTDMLNWQRDDIQSALPHNFVNIDERTTTLESSSNTQTNHLDRSVNHHPNKYEEATINGGSTHSVSTQDSTNTSFLLTKLMPLLLFSGVLLLTYTLLYKKDNKLNSNASSTSLTHIQQTQLEPQSISEIASGEQFQATNIQKKKTENEIAKNLQEELKNSISYITSSLSKINNVSSAHTAVEEITKANKRINKLTEKAETMPLSVKKLLKEQVNQSIPKLQALTKNANDIPEVGDIIKPIIQQLAESLTKLI
jgi:hypothetical protein